MQRTWLWVGFEKPKRRSHQLPPNTPQSILDSASKLPELCDGACPAILDAQASNPLRGLICVTFRERFQDACTPGWTEQSHFLREAFLDGARNAVRARVNSAFFFSAWETMPCVVRRARVSHRDVRRNVSVGVRAKFAAGVVQATEWTCGDEVDPLAVEMLMQTLSLQQAGSQEGALRTLNDILDADTLRGLKELPCIFLPAWIGQLLFSNMWRDLVFLSTWARQCPVLRPQLAFDEEDSPDGRLVQPEPAVLTAQAAETCVASLRNAFAKLSLAETDPDIVAGLRAETLHCISQLEAHRNSLFPVPSSIKRMSLVASSSLLRQVLAALDLSNRGKLKAHAKKFLECLPEGLRVGASAWVGANFASPSGLCRGRLMLDIAMLLFQRARVEQKGEVLRYMWGDATSKSPWEIYNIRYRFFQKSKAVELAKAWKWLCQHPACCSEEDELPEDVQEQRCFQSQVLFDAIEIHTQLPQLLGEGRTKLLDKVSAHVQSALLESGGLEPLQQHLQSCVAWCSDMGVEAGIPECQVQCVESVLPTFLRPARLQVASSDADFAEEVMLEAQPSVEGGHLMPNAIHIPGACHAIHNACLNLDSALTDFEWFLKQVQTLHPLISNRRRRERFLQVVLEGTPQYDQGKQIMAAFSATLHTERWGELVTYLRSGLPLLVFCRQFFDPVAYVRGLDNRDDAESNEFSVGAIATLLKDDFFFVYWQMQVALREIIEELLRWCEGCACHATLLQGQRPSSQEKRLRAEISCPHDVSCRCPLMGCRGPEMVVGQLETLAERLFATNFNNFIVKNPTRLSAEQWGRLSEEWHRAGVYVYENLKIRLGYFQSLPWVILGGAHPNEGLAKRSLQKALSLWGDLPDDAKPLQHRLAQDLFSPGSLRDSLDKFLLPDTSLQQCSELEHFLAPLAFVQIAERIIEGAHKDLGPLPKRHSMTSLSIQLRASQLNRCLALSPDTFPLLVQCFCKARRLKRFDRYFPAFSAHPLWHALKLKHAREVASTKYEKILRVLLYRDAVVQHGDIADAELWNQKGKKQREREHKRFAPKPEKLSQALLFAEVATSHVRSMCAEDTGLMLSIQDKFYAPIMLRPAGIHRPSHAPCTIAAMSKNDILVVRVDNQGSAQAPVVSALATSSGGETLNLCTQAQDMGLDSFLNEVRVWRKPGQIQLSLPEVAGVSSKEVSCLVQRMVDEHALPGCQLGLIPTEAELPALQALQNEGWAEDAPHGYILSQELMSELSFSHMLSNPAPMNHVRDLPLAELREFELMLRMKRDGWLWSLLPTKIADREDLKYSYGDPLRWYTAGVTVGKSYLLCLLSAERLQQDHGIASIPHALPHMAYDMILTGVQHCVALQAVQKPAGRSRKRAHAALELDADVEGLRDETAQSLAPLPLPQEFPKHHRALLLKLGACQVLFWIMRILIVAKTRLCTNLRHCWSKKSVRRRWILLCNMARGRRMLQAGFQCCSPSTC